MSNTENKDANILTNDQVSTIYNKLEEVDSNSNKEFLELDGEENNNDIPDEDIITDSSIFAGVEEFTEDKMREMGLDEETINDLKDVEVDPKEIENVEVSNKDYLEAAATYFELTEDDAKILLNILFKYKNNPQGKYYDELPEKIKQFADGIRANSPAEMKMTKNSSARFILSNITRDAQFGKLMDDYTNDMANVMNEMHGEFQAIIQESFDDLFSNIEKIKESNPEQAETLDKFYNSFKSATTFELQLDFIDRGVNKKKISKWMTRFDDNCFYFNRKVNSDANRERGIKFADIRTLIPTIKKARDGFTEKQIKEFIIVFLKSIEKMDLTDTANLFYIYGVVSAIDSFRFNTDFDTELGKTLFGNITKVIQKIISLN